MLTPERLRELLTYDPLTGDFTRRVARGNLPAGTRAGTPHNMGYLVLRVDQKLYLAHRLAWFYTHGWWPPKGIDHKDRNPRNNRIDNLRPADQSQNGCNRRTPQANTSGVKGVRWYAARGKWIAAVKVKGVNHHLGYFTDLDAAKAAVTAARNQYHGDFARHE